MIDYSKVKKGDVLRIVGKGAPGWANLGDLVRVKTVSLAAVMVEDRNLNECEFSFNCGAARLEPTEFCDEFPEEKS